MKQFESFRLDMSNECLWENGVQVALRPKPFAVLRYLVEHPGRLVTHDELLDALWPETYVQPQVLRTYVLELRKVLGDEAGQPRFIQTLPKRGYCFLAEVTECMESHLVHSAATSRVVSTLGTLNGSGNSLPTPTKAVEIVGRDLEMSRLAARMELLKSGQRQTIFITGEAGIGKTALTDAFCQRVAADCCVARGQCVEGVGRKEEYYPVMEALSQLCASPDGERACKVLARMAPVWLAALRRDAEAGDRGASAASLERMPGEICGALEELAMERPLLLVFEDLHWADESTLQLISALARRRATARLIVLATYRPQSVTKEDRLRGLKQDLLMRRLAEEIALMPLAKPAVKELMIRELNQEALPPGLASFVHQHSEGNPLFVIAILEHLIAQRFIVRECDEGAVWEQRAPFNEMEASVPDGLAQMIELEIERLTPDEQRLLEAASVMSVAFPAWSVAAALEMDAFDAEEACDELAQRLYFVERVGEDELPDGTRSAFYVFAHGLYREVLYQRQTASRRARRHVRVAERLSQLFAGREADVAREMALHYEAANQWLKAAIALRVAARHAEQRHAYAEAIQLFEHAMRIAENLVGAEQRATLSEMGAELDVLLEIASRQGVAEGDENIKFATLKA